HGIFFEHSDCLYDGAVHVPLVLRGGDGSAFRPGTRIPQQVENLDLAPTLLELAGVAAPPSFGGRSLFRATAARETARMAFIQHPLYAQASAENRLRRQDQIRSVGGEPVR